MHSDEPLPLNPTPEDLMRIGRESLRDARLMIASVDTESDVDASLKDYLLRVVVGLESLFESAPVGVEETQVLACALSTFLPVLDLDWLPASVEDLPKLSDDDLFMLELLRRDRARQAENKEGKPSGGRWHELINLISESMEIFVAFGYSEGTRKCTELLTAIEEEILSTRRATVH